uniref:Uncharacterized protein n=1 Tax=Globodera pallida TaxID=36090 RepID=A0A183CQA2_GLOPA
MSATTLFNLSTAPFACGRYFEPIVCGVPGPAPPFPLVPFVLLLSAFFLSVLLCILLLLVVWCCRPCTGCSVRAFPLCSRRASVDLCDAWGKKDGLEQMGTVGPVRISIV